MMNTSTIPTYSSPASLAWSTLALRLWLPIITLWHLYLKFYHLPHVLNYGMGLDSTTILARWLTEPETRPFFHWSQLLVIMAQTGDEFPSTKELVETHILPHLRQLKVRTVQLAKAGPLKSDGYTVLEDTHTPYSLHIEGDYKLSDELSINGVLPRLAGPHICARKFKGIIIDLWLQATLYRYFVPYLGYNADEQKRAAKSDEYSANGNPYRFPLIEWLWTRLMCQTYIRTLFNCEWLKSCCSFCPYIQKSEAVARWNTEPKEAGFALFLEYVTLAINPRNHLFNHGTAFNLAEESNNIAALTHLNKLLEETAWALYRVERTWEKKPSKTGKPFIAVNRRIQRLYEGDRHSAEARLTQLAREHQLTIETSHRVNRLYSHRQSITTPPKGKAIINYPTCEGFWVVAPATVANKVQYPQRFQNTWDQITGSIAQLSLL